MPAAPVLAIQDLRTEFRVGDGWRAAIDGLSLRIAPGETLALIGESGCGKSMTALSVMGLVPALDAMPAGCRFQPRCPLSRPGCERPQVLADPPVPMEA